MEQEAPDPKLLQAAELETLAIRLAMVDIDFFTEEVIPALQAIAHKLKVTRSVARFSARAVVRKN